MTSLNQLAETYEAWMKDSEWPRLPAVSNLVRAWSDARELADAGHHEASLELAAKSSLQACTTWGWEPQELLAGLGLGDSDKPSAWGAILAKNLVEEPPDISEFWRERIGQFAEEGQSAEDAASALSESDASPERFLLSLSGVVAECLATTMLVAELADRDWEALVVIA